MKKELSLNNGTKIPMIGFGTWRLEEGEQAYNAVKYALEVGYRHIDTAQGYQNESSVGQAILDSGIDRQQLYVTTKVVNTVRGYDNTTRSIEASLEKLKMDYLDLVLIHWPNPKSVRDKGENAWKEANAETWRALEDLVEAGKIRSIGISNFLEHHIEELLKTARIKPVLNQIKIAPGCYPEALINYCRQHEIELEAYSPLGAGELFSHETVLEMAKKYDCTAAQLALRWVIDRGCIPLPRSTNPKNIQSNLELEGIEISEEDSLVLQNLTGMSGATDPNSATF